MIELVVAPLEIGQRGQKAAHNLSVSLPAATAPVASGSRAAGNSRMIAGTAGAS
jgi:hypothetical protein